MALRACAGIHPTAIVSETARIGKNTSLWAFVQVREGVVIARDCMIGNGTYIDRGVRVGNRVNIHNKALLYRNLRVEDDVFIGPAVCFTNDPAPRANRIRNLGNSTWFVKKGASIGANSTVMPGVSIGKYAMVGAGSVVTKPVPDYGLVYGVPARLAGFVSPQGDTLKFYSEQKTTVILKDSHSNFKLKVSKTLYEKIR